MKKIIIILPLFLILFSCEAVNELLNPSDVVDTIVNNTNSFLPTLPAPVFNPAGGSFTNVNSVNVSFNCATNGAGVYWSTNGVNSWNRGSSIVISSSVTIFAKAVMPGYNDSAPSSAIFSLFGITNYQLFSSQTNFLGSLGLTVNYFFITDSPLTCYSNYVVSNSASLLYLVTNISNAAGENMAPFRTTNAFEFTNFAGVTTNFLGRVTVDYQLFLWTTNSLGTNGPGVSCFSITDSPVTWFSNFVVTDSAAFPFVVSNVTNACTNGALLFSIINLAYFTNFSVPTTNFTGLITVDFEPVQWTTNSAGSNGQEAYYYSTSILSNFAVSNTWTNYYVITVITNAKTNGVLLFVLTNLHYFENYSVPTTNTVNCVVEFAGNTPHDGDYYGFSVSVSSNGGAVAVGADLENVNGAMYVYRYGGGEWTTNKFAEDDPGSGDEYGISVAVSADGNTVVCGANLKNSFRGAIYIYKYSGGTWTTNEFTAFDGANYEYYGSSVAVSADGDTVVSGAYYKNSGWGAIYIYKYSGGTWATNEFTAFDGTNYDYYGWSVAVSADGHTVVSGAYHKNSSRGAIYIYKYSGGTWATNEFTAPDAMAGGCFGYSVAVSADGNTVVAGAYGQQSIYVYHYDGGWTEEEFYPSGPDSAGYGWSVAVSGDGKIVIAGAYGAGQQGMAYIYQYGAGGWTTDTVAAADIATNDQYGWSVAVSGDGKTAVIGANGKSNSQGVAYIIKSY